MESILTDIIKRLEKDISVSEMILFRKHLSEKINDLLIHNFAALVQLLYRIDIDENRLKTSLLQRNNEQASDVIADMIIQRIQNTITTKKHFKDNPGSIDESLQW